MGEINSLPQLKGSSMTLFRDVPSRGFFLSGVLGYEAIFLKMPDKLVRGSRAPNALCLSSFDAITHRFDGESEIRSITRAEAVELVVALSSSGVGSWDAQLIDEVFIPIDPGATALFPFGRLGLSSS